MKLNYSAEVPTDRQEKDDTVLIPVTRADKDDDDDHNTK